MQIKVTLLIEVDPGTMTTAEEITEDATRSLFAAAQELGFAYGPPAYSVTEVTVGAP